MSAKTRVRPSVSRVAVFMAVLATAMTLALPASAGRFDPPATLLFTQQPTDSSAGEVISPAVVVTAKNSTGGVAVRWNGIVTLTLQGPGTLYGTVSKNFVAGVASFSDLAVDPAGTYQLVATSGKIPSGTSNPFVISGFASACGAGSCFEDTGNVESPTPQDSIVGKVTVPTGPCAVAPCFLSIDETPGDFCLGVPCRGNAVKFIPPSNAIDTIVATWACDKSACSGTGVAHFRMFLERADLTVVELFDCPSPAPGDGDLPCINERSRTGVGDLIMEIWLHADGDPRFAGS